MGVPIPAHYATETKHIEAAIQQALKDADELRITGNEITPFLLQHIANLTKGMLIVRYMHRIKSE